MNKIYRDGNYLIVEYNGIVYPFPIVTTIYTPIGTDFYSILSQVSRLEAKVEKSDYSSFYDESGTYNFSEAEFVDILRKNTGNTDSVYNVGVSGWASYTDTAYTVGSPLALTAGVTVALPNNKGITVETQKPYDVDTFYNGSKITGRNGDNLDIQIYFKCIPSAINAELDVWIDIGGSIGELYRQTIYFRGTTVKGVMYSLASAYTLNTWETNGGIIYVKPSANMTVYGMTYNFDRSHKAK